MADSTLGERTQYKTVAAQYDTYTTMPGAVLEGQLVAAALTSIDVRGKTVLDLGGGTGLRAREAVEAGAALVDLVDVSPEMVKVAQTSEEKLSRKAKMRFFVADAAEDLKSLSLGLQPQYDVVLVNWLLDHATSNEDLEAFWRNIATYTKPGGSFVNIRTANPRSASVTNTPKYGVEYRNIRDIPGGVAVQVHINVSPPLEFEGTCMEKMYNAESSAAMYEQYGFEDVRVLEPEGMEVVKKDLAFWKVFLDDPWYCCVVARKR